MSQLCSDYIMASFTMRLSFDAVFGALESKEDEEDETFCRLVDLQTTCRCDFACGSFFDTPERWSAMVWDG